MQKIEHVFRGSLEVLSYLIFLIVYANIIDPAITTVDTELRDTWTKPNSPERIAWDAQNWISDKVGTVQDTRTLLHKIGNIFIVLPIVPAVTVGRRIWLVRREEDWY